MGLMLKSVIAFLSLVAVLLGICILRALILVPSAVEECRETESHQPIRDSPATPLIRRFAESIRYKTITTQHHEYDRKELARFIGFLRNSYPAVHNTPAVIEWDVIQNYSLLYHVKGSDPSLKPYLLAAHLDVVPVERDKWDMDPFAGEIRDGYLYGRGTIDVKDLTMGIMEAMEFILTNTKGGFKPRRSFFIAFGHDEEAQGLDGAQYLARTLADKYQTTELEYVLDEGTTILKNAFPSVDSLVAMIGVSEKGYLTLKMTARGQVGHSSMAPQETAIVKLSRALTRFTANAHPNMFDTGPEGDMIRSIAPYCGFPLRVVFSNLWLFHPVVSYVLSLKPATNAFIRTTSAVTMIQGGFKENVLPSLATAYINHRIQPSSSVAEVLRYDRALIADDEIELEIVGLPNEPHPVSPYDETTFGYQIIKSSIRSVFGSDVAVVPGVMIAATDTRWYLNMTRAVYRFNPIVMEIEDMKLFHGHNERIGVDNYVKLVNYYHHVILTSDGDQIPRSGSPKDEL